MPTARTRFQADLATTRAHGRGRRCAGDSTGATRATTGGRSMSRAHAYAIDGMETDRVTPASFMAELLGRGDPARVRLCHTWAPGRMLV